MSTDNEEGSWLEVLAVAAAAAAFWWLLLVCIFSLELTQ